MIRLGKSDAVLLEHRHDVERRVLHDHRRARRGRADSGGSRPRTASVVSWIVPRSRVERRAQRVLVLRRAARPSSRRRSRRSACCCGRGSRPRGAAVGISRSRFSSDCSSVLARCRITCARKNALEQKHEHAADDQARRAAAADRRRSDESSCRPRFHQRPQNDNATTPATAVTAADERRPDEDLHRELGAVRRGARRSGRSHRTTHFARRERIRSARGYQRRIPP